MQVKEQTYSLMLVIGSLIGILVFGGSIMSNYLHTQERLTSLETKLDNVNLQLRDINEEIKLIEKRK